MARKAINAALSDLSKNSLEQFCSALLDRKDEPRIRRSAIEDKSRIQITDKIVTTFTEDRAIDVVVQLLEEIDCNEVAEELRAKKSEGTTAPIQPQGPAASVPVAPKGASASATEIAFVDNHRSKLIERVTAIPTILDILLENRAIKHDAYSLVRAKPTNPEKMRELYEFLKTDKAKLMFYQALTQHEDFLLEELQG